MTSSPVVTVPSQALVMAMAVVPSDAERPCAQIELKPRLAVVRPWHPDVRLRRLDLLQIDRHAEVADLADPVVIQQDVASRQIPVDDLKAGIRLNNCAS